MNMQAMLKQAQNLQKKMLSEQETINNSTFTAQNGLVKVTMKGKKIGSDFKWQKETF